MTGYTLDEIEAIAGWLRDGLTAQAIAQKFADWSRRPVSRNAIIGIVLRNKVLHKIGFARSSGSGKPKRVPQAPKPVIPALKIDKNAALYSQNNIARKLAKLAPPPKPVRLIPSRVVCREITLLDLKRGECRWPCNTPAAGERYLFCALPADPDRSYCPHHYQRSIGRGTESERSAERVLEKAAAA